MIIQDWHETAERWVRLPPERRARQIVLLRSKACRFSPHGLQPDKLRTGKAAKLIDLYARLNCVDL